MAAILPRARRGGGGEAVAYCACSPWARGESAQRGWLRLSFCVTRWLRQSRIPASNVSTGRWQLAKTRRRQRKEPGTNAKNKARCRRCRPSVCETQQTFFPPPVNFLFIHSSFLIFSFVCTKLKLCDADQRRMQSFCVTLGRIPCTTGDRLCGSELHPNSICPVRRRVQAGIGCARLGLSAASPKMPNHQKIGHSRGWVARAPKSCGRTTDLDIFFFQMCTLHAQLMRRKEDRIHTPCGYSMSRQWLRIPSLSA